MPPIKRKTKKKVAKVKKRATTPSKLNKKRPKTAKNTKTAKKKAVSTQRIDKKINQNPNKSTGRVKFKILEKTTKGKRGRPKKEWEQIAWKGWQEDFLAKYMVGASDIEIKGLIILKGGIYPSNDLWTRWIEEDREFSDTIKNGKILSQIWWEEEARSNTRNKFFNTVLWIVNVSNRFRNSEAGIKWKQRISHENEDGSKENAGSGPVDPKAYSAARAAMIAKDDC